MKIIKVTYVSEIPKNYTGIVEWPFGIKEWYKNGLRHREDDPAVEYADGEKEWYKNGLRHREGGPAVESNRYRVWWLEGNCHRLDGPAIEYSNGGKEWWIEGQEYIPLNIKDYIVLEYSEGKHGVMWYRLLDKDKIIDYPDIPGLIER